MRDWFSTNIGRGLSRHDLLVSGGGQSALSTIVRTLTQPGDPLVVEAPTYAGTIAAGLAAGLRLVPIPMDDQGMQPDALEEVLSRSRARVVVVQPYLWAALPSHHDADQYTLAALASSVALTSGSAYYATGPALPHIRISYVATASVADPVSGIERLPRVGA